MSNWHSRSAKSKKTRSALICLPGVFMFETSSTLKIGPSLSVDSSLDESFSSKTCHTCLCRPLSRWLSFQMAHWGEMVQLFTYKACLTICFAIFDFVLLWSATSATTFLCMLVCFFCDWSWILPRHCFLVHGFVKTFHLIAQWVDLFAVLIRFHGINCVLVILLALQIFNVLSRFKSSSLISRSFVALSWEPNNDPVSDHFIGKRAKTCMIGQFSQPTGLPPANWDSCHVMFIWIICSFGFKWSTSTINTVLLLLHLLWVWNMLSERLSWSSRSPFLLESTWDLKIFADSPFPLVTLEWLV